jgi:hypothetical protein
MAMLAALDRLEQIGYHFPERRVTILATQERADLGDRLAAMFAGVAIARAPLDHAYYSNGVRYQISARAKNGAAIPLIDGGAFDWIARLTSNAKAAFVASGIGSQIVPLLFGRGAK